MIRNFKILVLIWMLQLTASRAQNHTVTDVMTGEVSGNSTEGQKTMQKASTPSLQVSDQNITLSITARANPAAGTQTAPSSTFFPNISTTAIPTISISPHLNTSTVSRTIPTTVVKTVPASSPTTARVPIILSSSAESQNTDKTSTLQLGDKTTQISTHSAQSTHLMSTTANPTKPTDKSTKPSPNSISRPRTSPSTTPNPSVVTRGSTIMIKTPINHITKEKKGQDPPETKQQSNDETKHGKAAAGLIGAALIVMMLGFLVIFIKKRRLQKQKITTTDWAGPSPFLESAAENGHATQRSSNRISLASFLPVSLSKRFSLHPETDEELQDMTGSITFGEKHQGLTFGQNVDNNDVQESNGTTVGAPDTKSTEDAPETAQNSVLVTSSQPNNPISTNDNSDNANLKQDSAMSPTVPEGVENALVQLNDDLK